MTSLCPLLKYADDPTRCDMCGKVLRGRQKRWCSHWCSVDWLRNHRWSWARGEARKRDNYTCVRDGCDVRTGLEVNHIVPRNGAGYGTGCWNHLEGLETLCHEHHLLITAAQRAERLGL